MPFRDSFQRRLLLRQAYFFGVPSPHLLTDQELRRAVEQYNPRTPPTPNIPVPHVESPIVQTPFIPQGGGPEQLSLFDVADYYDRTGERITRQSYIYNVGSQNWQRNRTFLNRLAEQSAAERKKVRRNIELRRLLSGETNLYRRWALEAELERETRQNLPVRELGPVERRARLSDAELFSAQVSGALTPARTPRFSVPEKPNFLGVRSGRNEVLDPVLNALLEERGGTWREFLRSQNLVHPDSRIAIPRSEEAIRRRINAFEAILGRSRTPMPELEGLSSTELRTKYLRLAEDRRYRNIYDWFVRQGPEFKEEVGGYATVGVGGKVPSEYRDMFEEAIRRREEDISPKVISLNTRLRQLNAEIRSLGPPGPTMPDYVRQQLQELKGLRDILQNDYRKASDLYLETQSQRAQLNADRELAHDLQFGNEITKAKAIQSVFQRPQLQLEDQRVIEQIRHSYPPEEATRRITEYLEQRQLTDEASLSMDEMRTRVADIVAGRYTPATDDAEALQDALSRISDMDQRIIERAGKADLETLRTRRTFFDLTALGAMPNEEGIVNVIRTSTGEFAGHQIELMGMVNAGAVRTAQGWQIPEGRMTHAFGLIYRPATPPLATGFTELERHTSPAPILKAFEISGIPREISSAAFSDRYAYLFRNPNFGSIGQDAKERILAAAVEAVDKRYSETLSAKVAGMAEKLSEPEKAKLFATYSSSGDAIRTTVANLLNPGATISSIEPGKLGSINREAFSALVDPVRGRRIGEINSELRRLRGPANAARKAELALEKQDLLTELGRGEVLTPARVAQEIIGGALHAQPGSMEPYWSAYIALYRNPRDDFSKSVISILNSLIPENKKVNRTYSRMWRQFRNMARQGAPTLGIDPDRQARSASIRREVTYIRGEVGGREIAQGLVPGQAWFSGYTGKPGILRARNTEITLPDEVVERVDEFLAEENASIRRAVEHLSDLAVAREAARVRFQQAQRNNLSNSVINTLRERSTEAITNFLDYENELKRNPRRFSRISRLYISSKPTAVDARVSMLLASERGSPREAYELYRRALVAVDPNSTIAEIESKQALARRQAEFVDYIGRVSAGQIPGVSLHNVMAEHIKAIQNSMVTPEAQMQVVSPLYQTLLDSLGREPRPSELARVAGISNLEARQAIRDIKRTPGWKYRELYESMSGEADEVMHREMAKLFGWDHYTATIFEDVLGGSNLNPFFGTDPGTILEHLIGLQREGFEISANVAGFSENMRKLDIIGADQEVRLKLVNVRKLADEIGGAESSTHIAATFHVLGQSIDNDLVPVMAGLNYSKYVKALKDNPITAGWNPESKRGRTRIMEMAASDLRSTGGAPPAITYEMEHHRFTLPSNVPNAVEARNLINKVNDLAVNTTGRPVYDVDIDSLSKEDLIDLATNARATLAERTHNPRLRAFMEVSPDEETAALLTDIVEKMDTVQYGGFYVKPSSESLERMVRARYLHMSTNDLINAGVNTVTRDRNTTNTGIIERVINSSIAQRAVRWRNPEGLIRGVSKTAARSRLITDERYLPINPLSKERLVDWWDPVLEDVEKELQSHNLNWRIAHDISKSFEGIKGEIKAINLGEFSDALPHDLRMRARADLGMKDMQHYLYAPLAYGKQMDVPKGAPPQTLMEMLAEARIYKTMPEKELRQRARVILGGGNEFISPSLAGMSREQVLEAMASAGFDVRPETFGKKIGSEIARQIYGMLEPSVYNEVLAEPKYSPVKTALEKIFSYNVPLPEGIETASELGTKANRLKEAAIKSQFYQRINFKTIADTWKNEPLFRRMTYVAGAIGLVGIIGGKRKKKDHTIQDASGPDYLPGGSAYEQPLGGPPGFTYTDNGYLAPSYQPGVIYQVRANGNYDPDQFQQQLQAITGGSVRGNVYSNKKRFNNQNTINQMQAFYG